MGGAKALMMEEQAQGFYSKKTYVCINCIDDEALKKYIRTAGNSDYKCSYCENNKKIKTIKFNEFIKFFLAGLSTEWGDPNNEGVAWEHGWMGNVLDTYDVITNEINITFTHDQLRTDVLDSLSDHQWCQKNFYQL